MTTPHGGPGHHDSGPRSDHRPPLTAPSWARRPEMLVAAVALLTVVLLSGLAAFALLVNRGTVQDTAQQGVRSNRESAVRALGRQGDALKLAAATVAADPPVVESLRAPTPATLDAVQSALSTLARGENSHAAFVTDATGVIVAFFPAQPAIIGGDFSYRDWFHGVSRTGTPYVSSLYRSAAVGDPLVVAVSAPVFDGARAAGSVTVLWRLDSVRSVIDSTLQHDGVTLVVTDQRGQPLVGDVTVDERGEQLPVPLSAATRRALDGYSTSIVTDGAIEETGPIASLGWTVSGYLPASLATAPAVEFERNLFLAWGFALLFLVLLTLLAGKLVHGWAEEQAARRVAEASLKTSAEQLRRVFDEALTGKLLVDGRGNIVRVNSALTQMLGRASEDLIGSEFAELFDDATGRLRIGEVVEAGDGELRDELLLHGADGHARWGRLALSWMGSSGGEPVLLAQIEDVTAAVTAKREQADELVAKTQFLSHASHELRSPLAVVHQFTSLLADGVGGPLTVDQRDFLSVVTRNAGQLKAMIDDLLEVSRAGTARPTFECTPLVLRTILTEIVAGYTWSAQERHVVLRLDLGDVPLVVANADRVREVVTNLLDNALKFTPAGGQITVATQAQPDCVRVTVTDTGRGINAEDTERVFEQFFQADHEGTESRNGLGLGLFICRDLIERQGGSITAARNPGGGTTFAFTLPSPIRRRDDQRASR